MRARPGMRPWAIGPIVAIALLVAVGARDAAASAAPGSATAARCAHQRVDGGPIGGPRTVRFVLLGSVSCARAHQVVGAYFHKMKTGQCGRLNNFCALMLPGSWYCSIFSAGVSATAGGAMLGCANQRTSARIRVFNVAGGRAAGLLSL